MERWGEELYDSDIALDFLAIITDKLERELAFWLSPEEVTHEGYWLAQVLTAVELVLLLKRSNNGGDVFLNKVQAVQRWRNTFFSVWDEEWHITSEYHKYTYNDPEYRKQQRAAILKKFNDLELIAQYWSGPMIGLHNPLLLPQDYPLPFYSLRYEAINKKVIFVEQFISDLLQFLENEITLRFLPEKRENAWMYIEYVWVAIDLLALLSENYQQPSVTEQKVREWRAINMELWKEEMGEIFDDDKLYSVVLQLFDRLEAVAKQYPLIE